MYAAHADINLTGGHGPAALTHIPVYGDVEDIDCSDLSDLNVLYDLFTSETPLEGTVFRVYRVAQKILAGLDKFEEAIKCSYSYSI